MESFCSTSSARSASGIATVISADIPKAAQLAAGNTVRFEEIGVAEAQEIARERHAYLAHLAAETV